MNRLFSAIVIAAACLIAGVASALPDYQFRRRNTIDTFSNFTFNFTEFSNCTSAKISDIILWKDDNGEYIVTPDNGTTYDEYIWLDCVDLQDVGKSCQ